MNIETEIKRAASSIENPDFKINLHNIDHLISLLKENKIDGALVYLFKLKERYIDAKNILNKINLESSVLDLPLSSRARSRLHYNKVLTVKDLIELPDEQLFRMRNFGMKSINETREVIKKLNEMFNDEHRN